MEDNNYSGCMVTVDEREQANPDSIQQASRHLGGEIKPVKKGQVYLYDGEYRQIEGKPFNYCPWCSKKL